jgi:hypothetical protein
MDNSAPPTVLLLLFPIFVLGMWCAVSLVLSTVGGWRRLAESFPVRGQPSGRRFNMQGARVGQVHYGGCLTIYSSPDGIYLSVWPPFRLGHPPLFIPWNAVHHAMTRRFLWFESVVFDVGTPRITTLELSKKIFEGRNVVVDGVQPMGSEPNQSSSAAMISWQGKAVRVRARYVPRFLWTTASIDIFLGDQCALRTGGKLKLTGTHAATFRDGGLEHQIELRWGQSRQFRFPYQLRIDGVTVDDSHVQVENWYMMSIPAIIIVALLFICLNVILWHMTRPVK